MQFAEEFSRAWQDLKQDEDKFYIKYILEPFAKEWQTMGDLEKEKIVDDIVAAGKTLYDYEFPPDQIKSTFAYFVEEKTEQPLYKVEPPSVMAFARNGRGPSPRRRMSSRDRLLYSDAELDLMIRNRKGWIQEEEAKGVSLRNTRNINKWKRQSENYEQEKKRRIEEAGGLLGKFFGNKAGRVGNPFEPRFSIVKFICNAILFLALGWVFYVVVFRDRGFSGIAPSKDQKISQDEWNDIAIRSNLTQLQLDGVLDYVVPKTYYAGKVRHEVKKPTPVFMNRSKLQIDAQKVERTHVVWKPANKMAETSPFPEAGKREILNLVGKTKVGTNENIYNATAVFTDFFADKAYDVIRVDDAGKLPISKHAFWVEVPITMKIEVKDLYDRYETLGLYDYDKVKPYYIFVDKKPEKEVLEPQKHMERVFNKFNGTDLGTRLKENEELVKGERIWPWMYLGILVLFATNKLKDILLFFSLPEGAKLVDVGIPTLQEVGFATRPVEVNWKTYAFFLLFLGIAGYSLDILPSMPELTEKQEGKVEVVQSMAVGAVFSDFMSKPLDYIKAIGALIGTLIGFAFGFYKLGKWSGTKASAKLVSNNDIASALRATEGDIKAAAKMLSGFSF